MNYKAFLSSILLLAILGAALALITPRLKSLSDDKVVNTPAPITDTATVSAPAPTDSTVLDDASKVVSYYGAGEKLARITSRCSFGDCLMNGGGGLIGMTTLDGYYTTYPTKDMDGNEQLCHALYVKRGPMEFAKDSKFSKFLNKDGAMIVPLLPGNVANTALWAEFVKSGADHPVRMSVFIPDSMESGTPTCYSGLYMTTLRSDFDPLDVTKDR